MKKKGYSPATIEGYRTKLVTLSRIADLDNPDVVRAVIASKDCTVAFKEALCNAYDHYVSVNGLAWCKPFYKRERGLPYVAKSEQVVKLVARASRRYSLIFTLLAETGLRPVEMAGLTLRNFDLESGLLTVKSAKHGTPRRFKLKSVTLAMLRDYMLPLNPKLDDRLFPNASALRQSFDRYRNELADKLREPELRKIRLYDLRHYYATMLYHRTKDILHVKQQLGHRRLDNTLVYTHLVDFGDSEFICKIASDIKEAQTLIESGFEFVTAIGEVSLFRKPK